DQGSAVAAVAERGPPGALDFHLVIEAQVARIVRNDDIIDLERRDTPLGGTGRAPDLVDEFTGVQRVGGDAGESTIRVAHQLTQTPGIVGDVWLNRGNRAVDEIDAGRLEAHPLLQPRDALCRLAAAIVRRTLQDPVVRARPVLVREHVIVRQHVHRGSAAYERTGRACGDTDVTD